jgi:hypothetical protein
MTILKLTFAAMALGACMTTAPAVAETVALKATLSAASQVPTNDSKGTGTAAVTFDTASKKLNWKVTYAGLTGPATAGHFHGPADPGKNAGVAVPFAKVDTSPIEGSATLTDTQAADLLAGKYYVNIHTKAHPGGEIRGQVTK